MNVSNTTRSDYFSNNLPLSFVVVAATDVSSVSVPSILWFITRTSRGHSRTTFSCPGVSHCSSCA